MKNFTNKTILITGASSGIGKTIAKNLIDQGAEVINFDIVEPDYNIEYHKVDVKIEDNIKKAFENIIQLHGLVNCAGVYKQVSTEDTTKNDLDQIIDTNLKGTYLVCKYSLPFLKQTKGSIINIASALALNPEPQSPAYCASKAAIVMLTKCMALEYASQHIRINAVLPGPIDTPMLRKAFSTKNEIIDYTKLNPMKRLGTTDEVSRTVLFLLSDEASYITGGLLTVDGGESIASIYSR